MSSADQMIVAGLSVSLDSTDASSILRWFLCSSLPLAWTMTVGTLPIKNLRSLCLPLSY